MVDSYLRGELLKLEVGEWRHRRPRVPQHQDTVADEMTPARVCTSIRRQVCRVCAGGASSLAREAGVRLRGVVVVQRRSVAVLPAPRGRRPVRRRLRRRPQTIHPTTEQRLGDARVLRARLHRQTLQVQRAI